MSRYVLLAILFTAPALAQEPLIGFFASSMETHRAHEDVFVGVPAPERLEKLLLRLTEEPHVAGTPQEKEVAQYVREQFDSFGLETEVVEYKVFLNHPKQVSVKITEPIEAELPLHEAPIEGDKDSTPLGMFPGFHGYGASGSASGQVVYVNYGTPDDYKQLEKLGVTVEGKIALARYGKVFRGLKVKEAQEHGAVGALIYSDPADDGYAKGDVYPDGPMRPATSIQRGSVQFLSIQPGDPSTPGYPSTRGAKRVPREKMETVPHIPSLPISYAGAEKILTRLGGPRVPEEWQGGLPFSYHVGPGGAAVSMEVEMDEGLMPIYNVFARIPGSDEADQLVVLGNHRDAWTHGAVDPNSGTAVMIEMARGLSEVLKVGWQPRRTIILASWDAEEYGLVGSTEWAEAEAKRLGANAVAYINLDSAVTGEEFSVGGTPSLRDLVRQTAHDIAEPRKAGSIGDTWEKRLFDDWRNSTPVVLGDSEPSFEPHLSPLGSGSDYTAFLDHLGVPCVNFTFSGGYGVYHSTYDNFMWMQKYGDPGFHYHAAATKFYGLMAMRVSTADVIPFTFAPYAPSLREHLDELRRDTIRKARAFPGESPDEPPLNPDFTPIVEALDEFEQAGKRADAAIENVVATQRADATSRLNGALLAFERAFLTQEGLPPNRPWFRHVLYAPGTTTGYAAWPFPGPRQALEEKDAELFRHEMNKVVAALNEATRRLGEIAELVPQGVAELRPRHGTNGA